MNRRIPMTPTAQAALRHEFPNGEVFTPTHFLIEGTNKTGHAISYVNDKGKGYSLIGVRSFYAVRFITGQINETGTTDFKKHCHAGAFSDIAAVA